MSLLGKNEPLMNQVSSSRYAFRKKDLSRRNKNVFGANAIARRNIWAYWACIEI